VEYCGERFKDSYRIKCENSESSIWKSWITTYFFDEQESADELNDQYF